MTEARIEAPREAVPLAARIALAPLIALERSKGWKRRLLATLYLAIGLVAAVFSWRALSLKNLPDVGPPFDVAAESHIEISDAENAYVLYRQAVAALEPPPRNITAAFFAGGDWSKATPEARDWLARNRKALDLYRLGSERPRALYHQPGEVTFEINLDVAQSLRTLVRASLLEGSRLRSEGDMAGAWSWYRANLRSSRHLRMHATLIEGLIGLADLSITAPAATAWAADSHADPALIRRALSDVRAVAAITPPPSDLLKVEYLSFMKAIRRPRALHDEIFKDSLEWYHYWGPWIEGGIFLRREPERSRRVINLAFANWLAHCDEPSADRPKFSKKEPQVYLGTEQPTGGLSPDELSAWFDSTQVARYFMPAYPQFMTAMDRDPRLLGPLEVSLAEQLYRREHAGQDPPNASALVGPYLERLPASYVDPRAPTP